MIFMCSWQLVLILSSLDVIHAGGKEKAAKRRRTSTSIVDEATVYKDRQIEDWEALSRPALELIVSQNHLDPVGSRAVLANRLFRHFAPSSDVTVAVTA